MKKSRAFKIMSGSTVLILKPVLLLPGVPHLHPYPLLYWRAAQMNLLSHCPLSCLPGLGISDYNHFRGLSQQSTTLGGLHTSEIYFLTILWQEV